jgi:tritrans,polycis-undecaprenyl-diphosphate synthase [geranylgeranyl-diphosphate specific]
MSENKLVKLRKTSEDKLPKHIGIIPDGNRRWAKKNNLSTYLGHLEGYKALKNVLYDFLDAGIENISIYALSLENLRKRSKDEIENIYKIVDLAIEAIKSESLIKEKKVKIRLLGRLSLLPEEIRDKLHEIEEITKTHDNFFLNVLIMYDGQEEIVDAVKKILKEEIAPDKINRDMIKQYLYSRTIPEVDYIIRTGMNDGARISGFLLWDSSYSEFRFRNDFWPEYNSEMVYEDLVEFIERNRRKGR